MTKKHRDEGGIVMEQDRISELPDELRDRILSFLPLKDAVATSILSRQWQHSWASTTTLNFNAVGSGDPKALALRLSELTPLFRGQESRRYISWVDSVVEQLQKHSHDRKNDHIKKFRVCSHINQSCKLSVDEWIQFAMEKSVQDLHLDFCLGSTDAVPYAFPTNIVSKSLKFLLLRDIHVTEEAVESLVSNCPSLEQLRMQQCRGLVKLRVAGGASTALKSLAVGECWDLKSIEICHAKLLTCFFYAGEHGIHMSLSNVPSLLKVWYVWSGQGTVEFVAPLRNLDRLESLRLNISRVKPDYDDTEHNYHDESVLPRLPNLKELSLRIKSDDDWTTLRLLKACPHLERLWLKLENSESETIRPKDYEERIKKATAKCSLGHLKEVAIATKGCGFDAAHNVICYLIENATALEKIVIDESASSTTRPDEEHAVIEKLLKNKLPSTCQLKFVCMY